MEQRVEDSTKNMGSKLRKLQDIVEGLESDMLRKVTLEDLHKVEVRFLHFSLSLSLSRVYACA